MIAKYMMDQAFVAPTNGSSVSTGSTAAAGKHGCKQNQDESRTIGSDSRSQTWSASTTGSKITNVVAGAESQSELPAIPGREGMSLTADRTPIAFHRWNWETQVEPESELTESFELRFDEDADTETHVAAFGDECVPHETSSVGHMRCECLHERNMFDLLDHVVRVYQDSQIFEIRMELGSPTSTQTRPASSGPILIHVTDYQEAVEIDRCLQAIKLRTHLASPFSNWTNILGKLGTGQIDVIISTTTEIPYAEQVPWSAIYLPSALHLAMLTSPRLDWLGNYWFANHATQQPPRLVVRRAA
jgi:hypothetical protein